MLCVCVCVSVCSKTEIRTYVHAYCIQTKMPSGIQSDSAAASVFTISKMSVST